MSWAHTCQTRQELVPALKISSINRQEKGSIPHSYFTHEIRALLGWSTPLLPVWAAGLEVVLPGLTAVLWHKALLRIGSARRHSIKTVTSLCLPPWSSSCLPAPGMWRQQQPSAYFWVEAERSHEAKKHIPFLEAACSLLSKRVKTLHECFMNQTCVHFNDKASLAIWAGKGEAENLQIPTGMCLDTNLFPPLETLHLDPSNLGKFLCF